MKKYTERRLKEVFKTDFEIELNMPKSYPPIKARPTEEGGVRDRFFAAKAELPDEITVIRPFCTDAFEKSNANTLYVSPCGCDEADGSRDNPLKSPSEALKRLSGKQGGKIIFRGGDYNLSKTVLLTKEHSGTNVSPLILTAEKGETPSFTTSKKLSPSDFGPVSDEKILNRLKPEVRSKVLEIDLRKAGVTDFGKVGHGGAVLQINNIPLTLARYPNEGEELIPMSDRILDPGGYSYAPPEGDSRPGHDPWEIGITDPRCLEWEWNDDIWMFGALYAEWGRLYAPIGGFDREKMSMKGKHDFAWGVKYEPNNNYYFFNVLEELDVPGEWFLDRESGKLYLYPPKETLSGDEDIRFIAFACNVFECREADYVLFDNLTAGRCAGGAFVLSDCRNTLVQRCHVTGTCGGGGASAVNIKGGFRSGVIATLIEHFTNCAASVDGGDRPNLIPANNFIQNCIIINPHMRHGVSCAGCGNILSHNYIHNTTICDTGHNEGILEYNVVEGGDTETHDSGMIYVGGGGCSSCANHYRYNYFFDFAENDYGLYFDDLSRGMYGYGNIIVGNGNTAKDEWHSGGRSFNIHNGGEHCLYNNISIDAGYFAFGGDITYWLYDLNWNNLAPGILDASLNKRTDVYMGRNPTYKDYVAAVDQYFEDKKDPNYVTKSGWAEQRLRKPWCNNFENNVIVRANRPFKLDNGEETATSLDTNFITDEDPGFFDFENKDYRIRPDAPLFKKIPNFEPIPFEKMGPIDDFDE